MNLKNYKKNRAKKKDHPSLDIVNSDGFELTNKKVILCVAGSVAVYKSIELARMLMRHGADVKCIVSKAATKLVQPDYFKWATGNEVITKLTGELEHVKVADYKKSDLIVVYPATANTLGKLASGIDDTPISTTLTVALGSKIPIIMCLAMHQSMYENSAVRKNIDFLSDKINFISPQLTEGKAKAAEPEEVLDFILTKFGFSSTLHKKRILITAGPTVENIDPIRTLSNESSGKTGVLLASELVSAGADVTFIYGPGMFPVPGGVKPVRVKTTRDMFDQVKRALKKKFDIVIMAAAIADYIPEKKRSKIKSSNKNITIKLKKAPKIINQIKKIQNDVFLVGFKAETNISKKKLESEAKKKLREANADLIIANDIGKTRYKKNPDKNEVAFVDKTEISYSGWKKKEVLAKMIKKELEKRLND